MSLQDYDWGMTEMLNDKYYMNSSMIKDNYFLGVVLAKKYRYLRIAYNIFMFGLILSMIAFAFHILYRTQQKFIQQDRKLKISILKEGCLQPFFIWQMGDQFYFQSCIRHKQPVNLHPGGSRKISFVKNFPDIIMFLHRFNIRGIKFSFTTF